jgi:MoxR-like ATPase
MQANDPQTLETISQRAALLRGAITRAQVGLTDRESLVDVLALAAVAGEHVLVVGPPGTAKSQAVRRMAGELGGEYFEYLLGRFTEPNEIFGPVDLRKLREGVVEVETTGMLPRAEIAFLDEVFLGSSAILNTLLGVLNERVFRRGATVSSVPLRLCVGASNRLPDDPVLAAFADRFLVRVFVDPVSDSSLETLLETGWAAQQLPPSQPVGLQVLDSLSADRATCDLSAVRPLLATALRRLRAAGVPITDRRAVRCQGLIAAAATIDGRTTATDADLWPLPLIAPTAESQPVARDALGDLLDKSRNSVLSSAAEELSSGPLARADRLAVSGRLILDDVVGAPDRDARLRMEAILREIDAGFAPDRLPESLGEVRAALVSSVTAQHS